jgi:hypothetical protein
VRTDRTRACIHCRLRVPRGTRRCPRCRDDRHLVDLVTEEGHERLEARESRLRRGRWLFAGALASLAAGATTWQVLGTPGLAEALLFVGVGFLLASVFQGGWGLVRQLRIRDPEPPADGAEAVVEGRAVARQRLPLPGAEEEVVGYRLVGDTVRGPLDDAVLAPFTVVTEDRRQIEVDPTHALLDVPLVPIAGAVEPELVRRWGGDPASEAFEVGFLADGAPVRVQGELHGDRLEGSVERPVRVSAPGGPGQMRS